MSKDTATTQLSISLKFHVHKQQFSEGYSSRRRIYKYKGPLIKVSWLFLNIKAEIYRQNCLKTLLQLKSATLKFKKGNSNQSSATDLYSKLYPF